MHNEAVAELEGITRRKALRLIEAKHQALCSHVKPPIVPESALDELPMSLADYYSDCDLDQILALAK